MTQAQIGPKGEVPLPADVRERLGLKPGDRMEFFVRDNGTVVMIPLRHKAIDLFGMLPRPPRAISLEEMDEAIEQEAAERAAKT